MPLRYEFYGELNGDQLTIPAEIASRFRLKGIRRLRIVASSSQEEELELGARGIEATTIDTIAETQHYDRDIALMVLGGEGIAAGTELGGRLERIIGNVDDGNPE
jgi:hypothetical protein